MANTADVIILSSSPIAPRQSEPPRRDENAASHLLPRDTAPAPAPSSSTTTKPPKRSRFFPTPAVSDKDPAKQTKKRATKNPVATKTDDQHEPKKALRKAKKSTTEPVSAAPGDPPVDSVNQKEDAVKPTKGRPRKTVKGKEPANRTLTGKVTKASGDPPPNRPGKDAKKVAGAKSPTPGDAAEQSNPKESNALEKDELLHLDDAMRRRFDWTPPRETACEEILLVEEGDSKPPSHDPNAIAGFGKLLSDYNYSGIASNPRDLVQSLTDEGPTKRRRIDLVDSQVQSMLNGKSGLTEQLSAQGEDVTGKPKKTAKSKPKKIHFFDSSNDCAIRSQGSKRE